MTTATRYSARDLVDASIQIASPPVVYEQLMRVIHDPRSGAADVAGVISDDQGLTARVLKVVNSAFFSLPFKVDSVTTAVRVVGTSQIRDLAVATSVMSMFDDVDEDLLDLKSFWHHSLGTGVTARVFAAHRGEDNIERFLVAGLLHDLGKLIMIMNAAPGMSAALTESTETGRPLLECEKEHVGCHHAQVGGMLIEKWNFPPALTQAVAYHHHPRRADRFPVEAAAVHVADMISIGMQWGRGGQARVPQLDPGAWDTLGIDPSVIPSLLEDASRQLDAAIQLITG